MDKEECTGCKKFVNHESYSACGNGFCDDCCDSCYSKNGGSCPKGC